MRQKESKNIRKSKCAKCGKEFSDNRLIFNFCSNDQLCLKCYKEKFSQTPIHPKPFFIKSLKKH
jgi:hypothetical protein